MSGLAKQMAKSQLKAGEKSLYDAVLDDIGTGQFSNGDRLKVQDLADRYGTSTNPIREVLRKLEGEGIVDILPNRGAAVRKVDAETLRDIFEILSLLEPYFVRWFAETARPDQVAELERVQNQIDKLSFGNKREFEELDSRFHTIICESHYNHRAIETWRNLRKALLVFASSIPISAKRFAAIRTEHHALIDACRKHDVAAAIVACETHVGGSGEQMYLQLRAAGRS